VLSAKSFALLQGAAVAHGGMIYGDGDHDYQCYLPARRLATGDPARAPAGAWAGRPWVGRLQLPSSAYSLQWEA
jgi:hypothetical protein